MAISSFSLVPESVGCYVFHSNGGAMVQATLYIGTKNASSWAMRAWLALKASGYEFDEELVDIRRPQRFFNLARIGRLAPPASVPVLDTGRTVVYDSLAIMEFANDVSGGKLLPADIEARAEARALAAWQHAGLSAICRRISFESAFYPFKRALSAAEQEQGGKLFAHYEALLNRYGGPFLFGSISLADFMHVPTVLRLLRHDLDLENSPNAREWAKRLLDRPSVREWIDEADRLPHIWYDDYLEGATWPVRVQGDSRA
ncbi:glutathione S-transferase [Lysobacter sp. K5869]|uniref:glutathione S-transferase family protein n=1 Tax=Lysobacter sp. K5869 TaxID=2820808 RepID=UPI001C063087|nr:glutathione S-transferase family protein [Lysobacter sp. K5869]QWP75361.1 glutathione S-transferase [Lysobacter sp. K5869]